MELIDNQIYKYSFSGHDTFQCRQFWLKKGFDFVESGKSFSEESAVVSLGVGKNMVSSIHYWMKVFGFLEPSGKPTPFAYHLLNDEGWDPYLEDIASLWLLHYNLVSYGMASTYSMIFNRLRKERIEFTKNNFLAFAERETTLNGSNKINLKTVATDFDIFVKMYRLTDLQSTDKEDSFSGILTELSLLDSDVRRNIDDKIENYYRIENKDRDEIPDAILLYVLLKSGNFGQSISLTSIASDANNIGSVFALDKVYITSRLQAIASNPSFKSYGIIFSSQAGIMELQIKKKPEPMQILEDYYEN